jgi:very-short-patch-repair endonuclease
MKNIIWKCNYCNYTVSSRRKLYIHKKDVHNVQRGQQPYSQYKCEFCGKEWLATYSTYKNHVKHWCKKNPNVEPIDPIKVFKKHTEESKRKISEGMKKAHAEGRACEWIGRRVRSYAEQSWYNIFTKDFGEGTFENNFYVKKYFLDFAWPDKMIYFEVDGRTHFTDNGIKHDLERTEFLKKEGWTLIGRCNWSEYQKLSKEEKERYVTEVENSIRTSIIKDNLIMKPTKNINNGKAEIEKRFNKNGLATMEALPKDESEYIKGLLELKNKRWAIIQESNIDFTKYGWVKEIANLFGIAENKAGKYIKKNFPDFYKTCYVRK